MTKKDIVMKISEDTGFKQVDVKEVVQRTFDIITDSLSRGDKVELRNFGIFKVKVRKGRVGRNPRTGESVNIPDKKVVSFKSGMKMKMDVEESEQPVNEPSEGGQES
ncbi:MAG: integration host factor subunit beta [Candidatus Omnitrophica bacterium]|nr:integration host factor subunit beta [Candidatus Omnitrophota bacterium]